MAVANLDLAQRVKLAQEAIATLQGRPSELGGRMEMSEFLWAGASGWELGAALLQDRSECNGALHAFHGALILRKKIKEWRLRLEVAETNLGEFTPAYLANLCLNEASRFCTLPGGWAVVGQACRCLVELCAGLPQREVAAGVQSIVNFGLPSPLPDQPDVVKMTVSLVALTRMGELCRYSGSEEDIEILKAVLLADDIEGTLARISNAVVWCVSAVQCGTYLPTNMWDRVIVSAVEAVTALCVELQVRPQVVLDTSVLAVWFSGLRPGMPILWMSSIADGIRQLLCYVLEHVRLSDSSVSMSAQTLSNCFHAADALLGQSGDCDTSLAFSLCEMVATVSDSCLEHIFPNGKPGPNALTSVVSVLHALEICASRAPSPSAALLSFPVLHDIAHRLFGGGSTVANSAGCDESASHVSSTFWRLATEHCPRLAAQILDEGDDPSENSLIGEVMEGCFLVCGQPLLEHFISTSIIHLQNLDQSANSREILYQMRFVMTFVLTALTSESSLCIDGSMIQSLLGFIHACVGSQRLGEPPMFECTSRGVGSVLDWMATLGYQPGPSSLEAIWLFVQNNVAALGWVSLDVAELVRSILRIDSRILNESSARFIASLLDARGSTEVMRKLSGAVADAMKGAGKTVDLRPLAEIIFGRTLANIGIGDEQTLPNSAAVIGTLLLKLGEGEVSELFEAVLSAVRPHLNSLAAIACSANASAGDALMFLGSYVNSLGRTTAERRHEAAVSYMELLHTLRPSSNVSNRYLVDAARISPWMSQQAQQAASLVLKHCEENVRSGGEAEIVLDAIEVIIGANHIPRGEDRTQDGANIVATCCHIICAWPAPSTIERTGRVVSSSLTSYLRNVETAALQRQCSQYMICVYELYSHEVATPAACSALSNCLFRLTSDAGVYRALTEVLMQGHDHSGMRKQSVGRLLRSRSPKVFEKLLRTLPGS